MKLTRFCWIVLTVLCFAPVTWAADGDPISTETLVIDVPTAEVLDRYQASFTTRAYEQGSVMESIDFGVYPRFNIGASIAVDNWLGSSHSVKVLTPAFQAKWKIYDGNLYLPAVAIGYDGRRYGYGYDQDTRTYTRSKKYLDNRKGGYVTLTREVFVPGLTLVGGANFSDFDWDELYMFTALYYKIIPQVSLLSEWDNIRNIRDSRLNLGARFYLHPSLALDASFRRVGRGDESERILQLRYVTTF
ncbi:MAG: hypothetical protein IKW71_01515 [Elusimicrobiaceae bacterium]|nr:hypothetical protein [Elusimicrobiaceae bacterium]